MLRLEGGLWGKPGRVCLWSFPILPGYPTGDLQLKKEALRPPGGQPLVPRTASHLQGLRLTQRWASNRASVSRPPHRLHSMLDCKPQRPPSTQKAWGAQALPLSSYTCLLRSPCLALSSPFSPTHSSRSQFWPSALSGTLEDPNFCSRQANQGREQGNGKEGNSNASHRTQSHPSGPDLPSTPTSVPALKTQHSATQHTAD